MADLPPDPMSAAKASLGAAAADSAKRHARGAVVRQIKGYLPKFLWPLIPGEGGTVGGNIQRIIKQRTMSAIFGCLFTLVFFAIFATAILGVVGIIVYAVVTA